MMFTFKVGLHARCVRALFLFLACSSLDCLQVAEAAGSFKLMTYNIRYDNPRDGRDVWANRVDAVVELVSKQDVIGLQEVTLGQLKTLVKRLPEFDFYGVGRDDGRSGGEHAPVFFRKSRFEAMDQGTFWLSARPEQIGVAGWDASLPRICTWIVLKDKVTDDRWWIANTHFDHRGSVARVESGRLLRRKVLDQPKGVPAVVMGDFNCLPGSPPYLALVEDGALTDARLAGKDKFVGPESTWNGFRGLAAGRIIDHIFVRGPIMIEQFSILDPKTSQGRYASDHLPIRMIVARKPSDVNKN